MDQIHLLILLCVSMLLGSFFSGYAPMIFKMSDSKSRLLALMGSGILVGTALAIIIPEGIDSLYNQQSHPIIVGHTESVNLTDTSRDTSRASKTWTIGLSLVAGFVLMLFIDQFSIYQSKGTHKSQHNSEYSLANQEEDLDQDSGSIQDEDILYSRDGSESRDITLSPSEISPVKDMHKVSMRGIPNGSDQTPNERTIYQVRRPNNTKVTPTLGLVIHASADGIALGAAATTSHREVEMIIFLAIMLHKAPAAFSLVVFLLHRGLKHSTIRRHLLAFSLSAPFAAIVTYFGLSQSGKEALLRNNATGIAMLFSAGTFLYVATVHVLPELVHNKLLTAKELVFLVAGAFLPLLLAQTV